MFLPKLNPEFSPFLHDIGYCLLCIYVAQQGVFANQDTGEFFRSPKSSEIIKSFLLTYWSEIHSVDVNQHEMEAFFILFPENIARSKVLVEDFVQMDVGSELGQSFCQAFIFFRFSIYYLIKCMSIITLDSDKITVS